MIHDYQALAAAVTDAGFFTNGGEDYGTWHRIQICSKHDPDTGKLHGNSFWVSRLKGKWILGVWGGWEYVLPDPTRLSELCIDWLARVSDVTRFDFDQQLKDEFQLSRLPEGEFEREAGIV